MLSCGSNKVLGWGYNCYQMICLCHSAAVTEWFVGPMYWGWLHSSTARHSSSVMVTVVVHVKLLIRHTLSH